MMIIQPGELRTGCWPGDCPDPASSARRIVLERAFGLSKYEVTKEDFHHYVVATERSPQRPMDSGHERRPVVNVSWNDALAYAGWLSAETNRSYRLPSEKEWEYAARSGSSHQIRSRLPMNRENMLEPTDVGSGDANAWGLHDMHDNVSEWVFDCANTPPVSPRGIETLAQGCRSRIRRGSSWIHPPPNPGAALRLASPGELRSLDTGFRVALDVE